MSRTSDRYISWPEGKDRIKVGLDDLPKWSQWPARLLGVAPWETPSRTIEKIDQEYDKDKYARCLDYFTGAERQITPEKVKQFEFGLDLDHKICISIGDELYEITLKEARLIYYDMMLNAMHTELEKCKTVIELGAGYGFNLWWMQQKYENRYFWRGEYSKNAVELASHLYRDNPWIKVVYFNFLEPATYELIAQAEPPVVIFTAHAIEQLPHSSLVFDNLLQYRDKIQAVFHFEPVYELHRESLLGLMRRRYTEINNYNKDLLSELQSRAYICIIELQGDMFGLNPLNPTSIIHWMFE